VDEKQPIFYTTITHRNKPIVFMDLFRRALTGEIIFGVRAFCARTHAQNVRTPNKILRGEAADTSGKLILFY
jgi:hypothetical protein